MAEDTGADSAKLHRLVGRLREKLQKATDHIKERDDEIARLKGQVPAEGALTISKADADLLASYKALGTPEAIRKAKEDGEAAGSRLKALERKDKVTETAKAAGVDPDALWHLVKDDDKAELLVKEQDGVKTLAVKTAEGEKTPEEAWGPLARALSPAEAEPAKPAGKFIPPQRDAGRPPKREVPDEQVRKDITKRVDTTF